MGDNRGVQKIWGHRSSRGHLGSLFKYAQNSLLHLHISIDFDETRVKRSLARGSFVVFRNVWSEVIFGSFGLHLYVWMYVRGMST